MARFRMQIGRTGTDDEATFELKGSDAWLQEVLPLLGYVMGAIVSAHGVDLENAAAVGNELSLAQAALKDERDYTGQFLTVTRTDFSNEESKSATPAAGGN